MASQQRVTGDATTSGGPLYDVALQEAGAVAGDGQSAGVAGDGTTSTSNGPQGSRAPRAETRERILRRLRALGRVSISDLAAELGVSPVTVHRHLATLEGEGLISRPRGGAQLLPAAAVASSDYANRLARQVQAKEAIARRAVSFLPGGHGAVFIDASTTCLYLAREIARQVSSELTIVTTSPAILHEFASRTVRVIALPGELDQLTRVVGGAWTVEFLSTLHIQAAFISGIGLTLEEGLTSQRRAIRDVLKEVVARSQQTYMLVDSSKFGRTALLHIAWPWQAAAVFSDAALPDEVAEAYRAREVNVVVAGASAVEAGP